MKRKVIALFLTIAMVTTTCSTAMANTLTNISGENNGYFSGICCSDGNLLVTDVYNASVWKLENDGLMKIVGNSQTYNIESNTARDGDFSYANFVNPWAIAPFLNGYAVTDAKANTVRFLGKSDLGTVAGTGIEGYKDGGYNIAQFNNPTGIVADSKGELYIADTGNGAIRLIDRRGNVSTYLSNLKEPTGLYWQDGELYIAETGKHRIIKSSKKNEFVVLAGQSEEFEGEYLGGYREGSCDKAEFESPQGVCVAENGAIYVADTGNGAIRKIENGLVTTVVAKADDKIDLVSPRGIIIVDEKLIISDIFSMNLLSYDMSTVSYSDMEDTCWSWEYVKKATELGLVNGTSDNVFSPNQNVTRAMLSMMIYRLCQNNDKNAILLGNADFYDVPSNKWYAKAVGYGVESGIIKGVYPFEFMPNAYIKRQDLVVMLYRIAMQQGEIVIKGDLSNFSDGDEVSDYAKEAMIWAVNNNIIQGNDGKLNPKDSATRAETAKILIKYMEKN